MHADNSRQHFSLINALHIIKHSPEVSVVVTYAVSIPTTTLSGLVGMVRVALKTSSTSTASVLIVGTDRLAIELPAGIVTL